MDQKISAVIITLNEERNIARCIESLQGVADEIVVIDSFSTDRTPEICKEMGVVFHQQKWLGYSAQKNLGHDIASHNYILSIDADEALSDDLRDEILACKPQLNSHSAYQVNILTNYCGTWIYHSGWYPKPKFRLFDKRAHQWQGQIHEALAPEPGHFHTFAADLLHFSYYSIAQHQKKIAHYAELIAQKKYKQQKRATVAHILLAPWVAVFTSYILKQGFRDGYAGLIIAKMTAYYTFMKYVRLRELQTEENQNVL